MAKFKVGDELICIESKPLPKGRSYQTMYGFGWKDGYKFTVTEIENYYPTEPFVYFGAYENNGVYEPYLKLAKPSVKADVLTKLIKTKYAKQ